MTDRTRLEVLLTDWQVLGATAGASLVLLGAFGSSDVGAMTWRLRLAGVAVGSTGAFFFDDPAAATLAPSPTPLRTRRWHRCLGLAAATATWWAAATVVLLARFDFAVPGALALELVAGGAVAVAVSLAISRSHRSATPGALGAAVGPAWFALGFIPRPDWVVVPPVPGSSDTSVLLGVTLAAVALMVAASRDPCSRVNRSWAGRCQP